jgi:hypothetical protein
MAQIGRLDWIAKCGFIARGLLYILFGLIALSAHSKADEGQSAVFQALHDAPGGSVLLILTAIGLVAYGVFRLICAWIDLEHKGSGLKGWAGRLAQAGSGIIHLGLAWSAVQFFRGLKRSFDHAGDQNSRQAARTVLDLQLGDAALYAIALAFLAAGALQFRKAWKKSHMKQCRADTPEVACTFGRIGLVSRGAVFAIVAWSFFRTAQTHQAGEALALGGAIGSLEASGFLFLALCTGLILFGVFSLMLARYRIVPRIDVTDAACAPAH